MQAKSDAANPLRIPMILPIQHSIVCGPDIPDVASGMRLRVRALVPSLRFVRSES